MTYSHTSATGSDNAELNVDGLPFSKAIVYRYVLDADHSNGYRA